MYNTNRFQSENYYLKPGYLFISRKPLIITTILGSCISVSMYDTVLKYGGLNHYIYPIARNKDEQNTRFGNIAIPMLYKTMTEFGSNPTNIVSHIIGGGCIIGNKSSLVISEKNIRVAEFYLEKKLNIKIVNKIIGGYNGRKMIYCTWNDEIKIIKIGNNN